MTIFVDEPAVRRRIRVEAAPTDLAAFDRCGDIWWRLDGDTVVLAHLFTGATISDEAAVRALSGLVVAGVLSGQSEFEAAMLGVVSTSSGDERHAWHAFYANSIAELGSGRASFAPVHRRARACIVGSSVLEVGCCFGLLAMQCALDGLQVAACDICPGALDLLDDAAASFGLDVATGVGDARALPHPTDSVDTVTLVHLLEHLAPADVPAAIGEALRVARRRVVIGVPFEEEPTEHFGHRQRLSEVDLHRWAAPWRAAGHRVSVFADHGGWLLIDADLR